MLPGAVGRDACPGFFLLSASATATTGQRLTKGSMAFGSVFGLCWVMGESDSTPPGKMSIMGVSEVRGEPRGAVRF